MKKKNKKVNEKSNAGKLPEGLVEFLAALGVVTLVIIIVFCTRSCAFGEKIDPTVTSGVFEDTSAPVKDGPTTTILNPIPVENITYPLQVTEGIVLDKVYTATGYFPEDGSDDEIKNVLTVKMTNTSNKTLEYLTFTLDIDGVVYRFAASTIPGEKSVYLFNTERKTAPVKITSIKGEEEYKIYFPEEPSKKPETLSYEVKNGSIVVTNISDTDIKSDIVVYYKATSENGYLGGITYRFRISGGLEAGKSFNAYAPHAYAHMTEIMFAQYEEK